jgi:hypothetical protein
VTILTPGLAERNQIRSHPYTGDSMARKQKNLAKTAIALAATALVEKAIQKASENPRVRRKAKAVGKAVKKRAKAAGRKIAKALKRKRPKLRRAAAPKRRKHVRA